MSKVGLVLDGKYEILKEIGQGGMSIVYVAMDNRLNKQWAIKELKNDGSQSVDILLKGIEREANILKKVDHPVLPRIVDIIEHEGTVYVVMDYIQGLAMDKILREEGAQPQEKVIEWAKQLASALDYLHSLNPPIIYRDMKPGNVMLQPDGRVKLIDFGTAKEYKIENIADTTALGTRGYAAPEQFGDEKGKGIYKTDARTDIYCLGATIYHIVTGKNPSEPPYEMKPIREWNPALSSGLENIILKCTQPNPEDRYQSCAELIYALEHYDELDSGHRKKQMKKLKWWGASVAAMLACMIVAGVGHSGMKATQNQDYQLLLSQAESYKIDGDYKAAADAYDKAITGIDSTKDDAYEDMLVLYKTYASDDEDSNFLLRDGLDRFAGYINNGYLTARNNSEVLKEVALTYFDEENYKQSLTYFQMLDEDEYPEVSYCITIATALSELNATANMEQGELVDNLTAFEQSIDQDEFHMSHDATSTLTSKIEYYYVLSNVYLTYADDIDNATESAIQVLTKAFDILSQVEDDNFVTEYNVKLDVGLAKAYKIEAESAEDSSTATDSYDMAISYSEDVLSIVSKEDDAEMRCDMVYNIAKMYEAMGETSQAAEEYESGIKEFGTEFKKIYIGYLSLLCAEKEKTDSNIENWDAAKILEVYDAGNQVANISNDITWKKLTQKLSPLFSKYGR